ncbi:protein sidekick homolog isoform X2 [Ptychodera flava]|uniref:protein sidekick homolog isoform X2 n=1 Tax=Ptychodera flava TaxID=63121 RepID=UPI003969FAB6
MTSILIVFLAIFTASSGLSLQAPRTLVVEQGSNLKILCDIKHKLNESSVSYTARDVHWYLADTMLPSDVQTVVNNTTTQLTLENVTIQDSGNYSCVLGASAQENIAMAITHLQVGTKPGIVNFTCVCYNMGDMWCTWEPIDSYLPTTYEFTWRLYYEPSWKACPDDIEKGPNSCFFDFYANQGSEHVMRVTATNALGQTEKDKHFNPDSDTIPYPPENVRVVVKTAKSVQVQWDPPSDWYADIFFLQYKVQYQSQWELGEWSQQPHIDRTEHYRVRGLEPFTTYDFRVSCKPTGTDGHWSAWSEISTGTTKPKEPDEGVRLFINQEIIKNVTSRDVTISWTLPEKRERNGIILGFRVAWLEEGSPSKQKMIDIQDGNQTMYTITDLSVFRSYTVSVVMYNSVGDSPVTQIRIVDKTSAPGAPKIREVKAMSDDSISVSWTPPTNPNGIITNYILFYSASDGNTGSDRPISRLDFNASVNRHIAKNLEAYVQYEFRVQAQNTVGYGGFSETITEYTLEGVPTGAPGNLSLEAIPNVPSSLRARWKPPCLGDRNGLIRSYNFSVCAYQPNVNGDSSRKRIDCQGRDITTVTFNVSDPHSLKSSREWLSFDIGGLLPNSEYAVSVSARTAVGGGPASEYVLQRTSIGAPRGRPEALEVPEITSSNLSLTWRMQNDSDVVIGYYTVGVRPLNNTDCGMKFMNSTSAKATLENLCGYETYEITVKACSRAMIDDPCGKDSTPMYKTTKAGAPSEPMDVVKTRTTHSSIELQWQPPKRLNSPKDGMTYAVQCFSKMGKAMTDLVMVPTTDIVISAHCDKSLKSKSVVVRCQVQAISAESELGPPASTDDILICYHDKVWPYVLIVIAVFLVMTSIALVTFKLYKCAKHHGAFDKVGHAQPIWEVKVPMQVNVYFGDMEVYDELLSPPNFKLKDTPDKYSIHSSDHGVVIDNLHPLMAMSKRNISASDQGIGGDGKKSKRPKSEGDEPLTQVGILRSQNKDRSRNRQSLPGGHQAEEELKSNSALPPSCSLQSELSSERADYSELGEANGLVGFQDKCMSKEDALKNKKGGPERRSVKPNMLVPLREDLPLLPNQDLTSISVFHAKPQARLSVDGDSRTATDRNDSFDQRRQSDCEHRDNIAIPFGHHSNMSEEAAWQMDAQV